MKPLYEIPEGHDNRPPLLCATGAIFADALSEALSLGSTNSSFWVVNLKCDSSPDLWPQFADHCINTTDAIHRHCEAYPDVSPWLEMVSRSPVTLSTFIFKIPVAVDFVAASTCRYIRTMFPDAVAGACWSRSVVESEYDR